MKCSTVDYEVVSKKCPDKTLLGCGNMFHDIITGYGHYTLCGMPFCDVYDGGVCLYPTGYNNGCYGVVCTL